MVKFVKIGLIILTFWHEKSDVHTDTYADRQTTRHFPTRTIKVHSVNEMTECKNFGRNSINICSNKVAALTPSTV